MHCRSLWVYTSFVMEHEGSWLTFTGNGRRPASSGAGDIIDVTPSQPEPRSEARNEDPRGKKKKGEKFRWGSLQLALR